MFRELSLAYYNCGMQLAKNSRLGSAVQSLGKAISYDSSFIEAWNLIGLCCYRLGKYQEADYYWQQSLQRSQAQNAATHYLADLRGSISQAMPYFAKVEALCQQKDYGRAAALFSAHICAHFPVSVSMLNYLGVLHVLDGKPRKASKCWTDVLSIDKDNVEARRYLNEVESRLVYKLLAMAEKLFKRDETQ
ncbi:MAG: tetratricopeptide repeat protein [Bacillota bacterium]|nr:tetratricopeptide repeat protein [Bacillota bacterium]